MNVNWRNRKVCRSYFAAWISSRFVGELTYVARAWLVGRCNCHCTLGEFEFCWVKLLFGGANGGRTGERGQACTLHYWACNSSQMMEFYRSKRPGKRNPENGT